MFNFIFSMWRKSSLKILNYLSLALYIRDDSPQARPNSILKNGVQFILTFLFNSVFLPAFIC